MKTVLLLSVSFPPMPGGVSKSALDLSRMFVSFGYRVVVATGSRPEVAPSFPESNGIRVVGVFGCHDGYGPEDQSALAELVRETNPSVLVVNGHWADSPKLRFLKTFVKAFPIPVVFRSHGFNTSFRFCPDNPPFFGLFVPFRWMWRAFRWELFATRFHRCVYLGSQKGVFRNFDRFLASLFHPLTSADIPNTFPSLSATTAQRFFVREKGSTGPFFVVPAMAGEVKNQKGIIRAFRRLRDPSARLAFLMPGRNDYSVQCERMAADDKRISFHYGLPRNRIVDAIRDCDAVVLFSIQEQQPLALLEAMSCGKPWISPDLGNVKDLAGGIVVRRGDASSFLNALEELGDPVLREKLGGEGKARWDACYSPDVVFARWKALLSDIEDGGAEERSFSELLEDLLGPEKTWDPECIPFHEISDASRLVPSPRVSVVCTSYNHRNLLEQALQSVLDQRTSFPYEIVIGEDGSTDGSLDWLRTFQSLHPDVVRILTSDENIGLTGNTLRCLQAVRAPYVAFLESDDYWIDSGKLAKQVRMLDEHEDVGFIFSNAKVVRDDGTPFRPFYQKVKSGIASTSDNLVRDLLEGRLTIMTSSVMLRAESLRRLVRDCPEVYCRDRRTWDIQTWVGLASRCRWVFLPEFLAAYRLSESSVTRTPDHMKRLRFISEIFSIDTELNRLFNDGDPATARAIKNAGTRGVLWSAYASGRRDVVSVAAGLRRRLRLGNRFSENVLIAAARFRFPPLLTRCILKVGGWF